MRVEEVESNNVVRCLLMQKKNDETSVGSLLYFDNLSTVEDLIGNTLNL